MSTAAKTLDLVVGLLQQVPGVHVLSSELVEGSAYFTAQVTGAPAIESLQRLALSANVGVEPWLRHPLSDTVVQQSLVARTFPRDPLEHGELQIFGIHLVWHLHKKKLLAAAPANSLLRMWHAAQVEA